MIYKMYLNQRNKCNMKNNRLNKYYFQIYNILIHKYLYKFTMIMCNNKWKNYRTYMNCLNCHYKLHMIINTSNKYY